MASAEFSDDSSDDENLNYLLASGMVPFLGTAEAGAKLPGSHKGKQSNVSREFGEALKRLNWITLVRTRSTVGASLSADSASRRQC